ncbi:hypothetical protein MED121_09013 [Marinomonas sp. MED121]|uniref:hypothetical protein n=1 Tax=Marinomonas sp. MED121 TaxID=314277 RepID=UPI0000690090|nr:hypothetical protein [Marinomonas sp. MED121]EAQ65693.1 hypothetical protein MED121_09013 [Marinomonas sp. MED121]
MIYIYEENIGELKVVKNIIVDDVLLESQCGFLIKEIVSDYGFKLASKINADVDTIFWSASANSFNEMKNKVQVKGDSLNILFDIYGENFTFPFDKIIQEQEIPLSISEYREKIVINKGKRRLAHRKRDLMLLKVLEFPYLPNRLENKINNRKLISLDKLNEVLSVEKQFLYFDELLVSGDNLSINSFRKCSLVGIKVNSIDFCKKKISKEIEKERSAFQEKILYE